MWLAVAARPNQNPYQGQIFCLADMLVPRNVCNGITLSQGVAEFCQFGVLDFFKFSFLYTLQLNADRVVIAMVAPPII